MSLNENKSRLNTQDADGVTVTGSLEVSFNSTKVANVFGVKVTADFQWVEQCEVIAKKGRSKHFRLRSAISCR